MNTELLVLSLICCIISLEADPKKRSTEHLQLSNNVFGKRLYNVVAEVNSNNNLIISSFSIYLALLMLELGACDKTLQALKDTLYLQDDENKIIQEIMTIKEDLKVIEIANKIMIRQGFQIKPYYNQLVSNVFGAPPGILNFNNREESAQQINIFVENITNHQIQNFIYPSEIDYQSVMILVNAVHFKAKWKVPFPKILLKPFYTKKYHAIDVPIMEIEDTFTIGEIYDLNAKFIKIPCENPDLEMIVIKPNEIDGLTTMEQVMQTVDIDDTAMSYSIEKIVLRFPKFTLDMSFQLSPLLDKIRLSDLLGKPDLSKIAKGQLTVSQVKHKTVIEVDEKETEASSATYVDASMYPEKQIQEELQSFNIDYPFYFEIRMFGISIFQGHVLNPLLTS